MSVEPYQWIIFNNAKLGINQEDSQPASIDLELGDNIKILRITFNPFKLIKLLYYYLKGKKIEDISKYIVKKEKTMQDGDILVCLPLHLYIMHTDEYLKIPETHGALLCMKSSMGRMGFSHNMAGWFDPGFEGQGVLEITTVLPGLLVFRKKIAQLIYLRLTQKTDKPYKGKYSKQKGAQEAL